MSDEQPGTSVPKESAPSKPTAEAESSPSTSSTDKKKPVCVLVIGMAGSGKTNVVNRLGTYFSQNKTSHKIINLDPAVKNVPYTPYIDIRDTVDYKGVMKQYELGPNGAIVTSLNLFSTKFDDVLKFIGKHEDQTEYVVFDTPGQIEVFNWSASGPIIAGVLASTYPTVIVYVVDTVRSNNTRTFMANMLYACSVLYKYKLPFIIAFNKTDITDCQFALDWMTDFEAFQEVLAEESSFASNLTSSLSLALEEFYCNITACGVSAHTGAGFDELETRLESAAEEFEEYREELRRAKEARRSKQGGEEGEEYRRIREQIRREEEVAVGPQSDSDSGEELDAEEGEESREGDAFKGFVERQRERSKQPPHA